MKYTEIIFLTSNFPAPLGQCLQAPDDEIHSTVDCHGRKNGSWSCLGEPNPSPPTGALGQRAWCTVIALSEESLDLWTSLPSTCTVRTIGTAHERRTTMKETDTMRWNHMFTFRLGSVLGLCPLDCIWKQLQTEILKTWYLLPRLLKTVRLWLDSWWGARMRWQILPPCSVTYKYSSSLARKLLSSQPGNSALPLYTHVRAHFTTACCFQKFSTRERTLLEMGLHSPN